MTRPNPKATVPGTGSASTAPEEGRTSRKAASPSPTTEEPPVTEEPSSTGEPSAEGPPEEKTSGEGTPSDELRPGGRRGSDLDPRFGTCKEANAHGYGPYVKGTDPEYRWYTDRDQDGIDCEPAHSRTP
ncbi:excalibur calcium-binding domain-containing protein [Actinomadura sp. NPDC048955]|uniref:excalibur calcium-binding domain-containing protein n=1 Tax=Actinomadura sp. NPDC048955 TaxID=3158228 RepID=UPI003406E973